MSMQGQISAISSIIGKNLKWFIVSFLEIQVNFYQQIILSCHQNHSRKEY